MKLGEGSEPLAATAAQSVTLTGRFSIVYGDPQPGSQGEPLTKYILTDDTGRWMEVTLSEALGAWADAQLYRGRQVRIKGFWDSAATASAEMPRLIAQAIDVEVRASSDRPAPEDQRLGPQTWITILCKFPDVAVESPPPSYFTGLMGSTRPGLDHYWRELSYNAMRVDGDRVVGPYILPFPSYHYRPGAPRWTDLHSMAQDCAGAADADVHFPGYNGLNLVFNASLDGYIYGGSDSLLLDGATQVYGVTWLDGKQAQGPAAHEMGHALGLPHSSGAYGQTYDNQWDVMSNACMMPYDPVYGCLGFHTIAYHKDLLGWIPPERKFVAAADTQTTLTLDQLALPAETGYSMATIPIQESATHFYTLEARRRVGYDSSLGGNAVIIHEVDTTRKRPAYVVDADQNGFTGDAGTMWTVGERFDDPSNGIWVSVDAETATGFVVTVSTKSLPWQVAPASGSAVPEGDVSLRWTVVPGVQAYELQLDTTTAFNSPELISTTVTDSSYVVSHLELNTYFWRVRATPNGAWTSAWRLTVGALIGDWHPNEAVYDGNLLYGGQDTPDIALDGVGNAYAVWQDYRNGNWDIYFAFRPAGGAFHEPVRVNNDVGRANQRWPHIAVAVGGDAYIVWEDSRRGQTDIYFAYRRADGAWGPNMRVNNDSGSAWQASAAIVVDRGGVAYAAWEDGRNSNADIYTAIRTTDGIWHANVRINDDAGASDQGGPALTVDGLGVVYAVWTDWRTGVPTTFFAERAASGAWGANVRIGDPGSTGQQWHPQIGVDAATNLTVVWQDNRLGSFNIYAALRPAGGAWSANQPIDRDPSGWQLEPALATDAASNVYVAWSDFNDIYFSARQPGGVWAAPQRVSDDPPGVIGFSVGFTKRQPRLASDTTGNLLAVWQDGRNYSIFVSSRPAGGNWGRNVLLDRTTSAWQTNPRLAVDAQNTLHAVWEDYRDGPGHIYAAQQVAGETWGDARRIDDDTTGVSQTEPALAVDPAGGEYVVWQDGRNGHWDIYFAHRPAAGAWAANERVNDDAGTTHQGWPDIAVDAAGAAYAVWLDVRDGTPHVYFARRPAEGRWGENQRVDTVQGPDCGWTASIPALAVDPAGNAYVVWAANSAVCFAYRPANGSFQRHTTVYQSAPDVVSAVRSALDRSGNLHVVFAASLVKTIERQAGGAWGTPASVDGCSYQPVIGADAAGNTFLACESSGGIGFAARPVNRNWGSVVRINDDTGTTTTHARPDLALGADGSVYAVWADGRFNIAHIYFSYARKAGVTPTPRPTPTATATSAISATPTHAPTASATPTPVGSISATPSSTAVASATPTAPPGAGQLRSEVVGHIGGASLAVAVRGSRAYLGVGPRLTVLDVSDPTAPTVSGQTEPLPGLVSGVAISGSLAYVAAREGGLRIVDVADPAHPAEIGFYDSPGAAQKVAVLGNYAYLADGGALRIIDVTNPTRPSEIGAALTDTDVYDIAIQSHYAFVAARGGGMRIIDVATPTAPVQISSYEVQQADGLTVSGQYAYVAAFKALHIVDIADPAHPQAVAIHPMPWTIQGIAIAGARAYVGDGLYNRMHIIDITDPRHPASLSEAPTPGEVSHIIVADGRAYVADGSQGLRILDVRGAVGAINLGAYAQPWSAVGNSLAVVGRYAYVAAGTQGMSALDISDPSHPTQVGEYYVRNAGRIAAASAYAYVTDSGRGLYILDIANPHDIFQAGYHAVPGGAVDVALLRQHAVTVGANGLYVINVSDPSHPTQVGACVIPGWPSAIAIAGDYAYVTARPKPYSEPPASGGLHVISLADPAHPTEVGFSDLGEADTQDIALAGNIAYLAGTQFHAIDITTPNHPQVISTYGGPWAGQGLALAGHYAYIAGMGFGVYVIDIADPAHPNQVGFHNTPGEASDVIAAASNLYVTDMAGGFSVLRFEEIPPTSTPTPTLTSPPTATATITPTQIMRRTPTPTGTILATATRTPTLIPYRLHLPRVLQ